MLLSMMIKTIPLFAALALCSPAQIMAQDIPPPGFRMGSAIPEYGPIAPVDSDIPIPPDSSFAIAFDVAEAKAGQANRTLTSAARFINMHVDAGVPMANIKLAIVVHGSAVFDMASDEAYARKFSVGDAPVTVNPNKELIKALQQKGVEIIICGQSAAAHQVTKGEFLPGVKMALSAMTAHALLQQHGYTLNPF